MPSRARPLAITLKAWRRMGFRRMLALGAGLAFIASCISMAAIYHDPFAHLAVCLGGAAPAAQDGALLLYGHCAWCYLALGLALSALIAPPKA